MKKLFLFILVLATKVSLAQSKLKPSFDPREYADLLSLAFHSSSIADSISRRTTTDPYKLEYRSPEKGFNNRWTLYLRDDNVASIDVRGTINQLNSWMANFYSAMIPAQGVLIIHDTLTFRYKLADDEKAMVHVGWTISLAHLGPDIVQKINTYYKTHNIKEFLIFGHSQGGAISFLLRSYLEYEKQNGNLPQDIIFKTYCSAGPKPGNMYYAYDFDFITRNGWGYNIINAADWVPELPFSIQTLKDLNPTNPIIHTKQVLKKQKLLVRIAGGLIYNKLEKPPRKAQRKFEKYLGKTLYKRSVSKIFPQLKEPDYSGSVNYMRAGIPIVLKADAAYREKFPESNSQFFIHHSYRAYTYLLKQWYQ